MDKINDGGPAFPRDHQHSGHNGMTLRDYFAAQALAGMCAASMNGSFESYAQDAYGHADAMLRAREGTA